MELLFFILVFFGAYIIFLIITDNFKNPFKQVNNAERNPLTNQLHLSNNDTRLITDQDRILKAEKENTIKRVERDVQIIVESLKIARESKNRWTKISRLDFAKDKFENTKQYINNQKFLTFSGLGDVEKLISDAEVELSYLDSLSSNSHSADKQNNNTNTFATAFEELDAEGTGKEKFWADEIKEYKEDPQYRLKIAIENLPLPGAFREAAIAIRAIIRQKRKNKLDHQKELTQLYWLAGVSSFGVPYSEVLREPGFNVMESIPKSEIKEFSFTYEEIGYNKLALLNKTDIKWITEEWGEPIRHSTLHIMYNDVWKKYELKLLDERKKFLSDLRKMF